MQCKYCGNDSGTRDTCPACESKLDRLTARKVPETVKRKLGKYQHRLMLAGGCVR